MKLFKKKELNVADSVMLQMRAALKKLKKGKISYEDAMREGAVAFQMWSIEWSFEEFYRIKEAKEYLSYKDEILRIIDSVKNGSELNSSDHLTLKLFANFNETVKDIDMICYINMTNAIIAVSYMYTYMHVANKKEDYDEVFDYLLASYDDHITKTSAFSDYEKYNDKSVFGDEYKKIHYTLFKKDYYKDYVKMVKEFLKNLKAGNDSYKCLKGGCILDENGNEIRPNLAQYYIDYGNLFKEAGIEL